MLLAVHSLMLFKRIWGGFLQARSLFSWEHHLGEAPEQDRG